jgi:xylulokinase
MPWGSPITFAAREPAWVGIDIGTAGVRAAAHAVDGRVLATGAADRAARVPEPGAMVHDPVADWWEGTRDALATLWATLDPGNVRGVGLAGLFPAACLVDESGAPLTEGLLYGDSRAADDVQSVADAIGVALRGDETSPRLRWLERTRPGVLRAARWALGPVGFVGLRLTDRASIDPHSAVRWGGLATTGEAWDVAAATLAGIPPRLLPAIRRPIDVLGAVTPRAAADSGLPAGVPVLAGTTDSFAQLLGDGVGKAGDGLVYYGSSGTLMVATADFADALEDPRRFRIDAPYRLSAYLVGLGSFLDRTRNELLGGASMPTLDAAAATVRPGAEGLFAYPSIADDPRAGRPPGPALLGLGPDHGPGHVWRAALESFGYLLMEARDRLASALPSVTAAGGGSRSDVWRQIVSDQTGWPQRVAPAGGGARGAAFLAALATGAVRSVDVLRSTWLPALGRATITLPDAATSATYAALREAWAAGARNPGQVEVTR